MNILENILSLLTCFKHFSDLKHMQLVFVISPVLKCSEADVLY